MTLLRESDFPKLFSAIVSDYPKPEDLRYEWKSSDNSVRIMSPHSKDTLITVDAMPSWDHFDLSVSTEIKGRAYTSSVTMCYGTNETPVASLSLSAPQVVFVNDDERTSRWYRVSAKLSSPTPTNAVLSISHTGGAQVLFASDPEGTSRFAMTNVNLSVDSAVSSAGYSFYFAATNNNCNGTFTATCTLADSTVLESSRGYKVIEPLRKLVCKDQVAGGYYNPSRLVYGTNAWLKVGVNGQFSASDVQWRVVSGPGRIVSRNDGDWAVSVEPTAPSGEVVVEAAFGSDSLIQPRFVLPIASKRAIPTKAFVVTANGTWAATAESISNKFAVANQIYSQVGIEFNLLSITTNSVGTANDMVVREYDYTTNSNGRVRKTFAQQAINLLNTYTSNDCVEVYFVRSITNGMATAFQQERGIIVSEKAADETLAHELGHALGLKDCYVWSRLQSPDASGQWYCYLTNYMATVSSSLLTNRDRDWGSEEGRAFYEKTDLVRDVGRCFIMYGVGERGNVRADIPNGRINCLVKGATDSSQMQRARIGADDIEQSNERVFSK